MGWLSTPEEQRRQQVHVVGMGSVRDLDRIHERDRRRNIRAVLNILAIISLLIGIGYIYYMKNYTTGAVFLIIGISIFYFTIFRRIFRKSHSSHHGHHRHHRHRHHRRHR